MKKFLSFIMCVVMLIGTLGVSASALPSNNLYSEMEIDSDDYKYNSVGDVNRDGSINAKDVLIINMCHARSATNPVINYAAADVYCDGKVNSRDSLMLRKYLVGLASRADICDTSELIDRFEIGGYDISEFCIVYDENAKYVDNMYFAADTLYKYVNFATDANLAVSTEATTAHKIEFVDVTTIPGLEEKLGIEGYKYEVRDGNLYIYGTRRGSLYAVWEILEEYLGYHLYSDEFAHQGGVRCAILKEGLSVSRQPALNYRMVRQTFGTAIDHIVPNPDQSRSHFSAMKLNGSNFSLISAYNQAYGGLTGPHMLNNHSLCFYWQMATGEYDVIYDGTNSNEYGNKFNLGECVDPFEWYPCYTNDEHYETLFRGLLETMRYISGWHTFRPETSSMSFTESGTNICSCNNCRYISSSGSDRKRGERLNAGATGLYLYIANRAAEDICQYYEGRPASSWAYGDEGVGYGEPIYDEYSYMKIYFITEYDVAPNEAFLTDERYAELVPKENVIMMWAAPGCNNHRLGSGQCEEENVVGNTGNNVATALKAWGQVFKASGAELWYWDLPVNYMHYLVDTPNLLKMYDDYVYLVEECNVTGIYFEGTHNDKYGFGDLRAHLAAKLMWSFNYNENGELEYMSYEEYLSDMKEYLYIFYGKGVGGAYNYIMKLNSDEASVDSCYLNNYDFPGDMYSREFLIENYFDIRSALVCVLNETEEGSRQRENYMDLIMNCDFLGLSACYEEWYVNDNGWKETYVIFYDDLYNYVCDNNIVISTDYLNSDEIEPPYDLSQSPMRSWYGRCALDEELDAIWD